MKYLRKKCNKTIQLLRTIAHTNWGGSKETLLKLYHSLIRSRLDYDCFIYGAARKTYLKELNTIHHQGLRLALRLAPLLLKAYTQKQMNHLLHYDVKNWLSILYKAEILPIQPSLLTAPSTRNTSNTLKEKKKTIKPFGLQMMSTLQESKIPLNDIHEGIFPQTPPWIIKTPKVILELNEHSKTKTHPSTYQEKFYNILQHHPDHLYVFTDRSKDNGRAACAAVLNKTVLRAFPWKSFLIFTVEALAIDLALNIILKGKHKKFIIFSDSLSVLLLLRNKKFQNPLIVKLLSRLDSMSNRKEIIICWTPSHSGMKEQTRQPNQP